MKYRIIQPPKQLAGFVKFFWFLEINSSIDKPFVHHAFAHHCSEIIFCYKGQLKYKSGFETEKKMISGIFGPTQTFSKVASSTDFGIFGFYLYPYALAQLFSLPANELTNQAVDMKSLCGEEGAILEETIMLASDNDQRLKLVCEFLEQRLKNVGTEYTGICSSIRAMSNSYTGISVPALAGSSFLSLRQFERKFKEYSGFNPKLFMRIAKFNSLLNKPFQNKLLTEIAYEYGYYDPAHFTHDFQQFSNQSPKDYFKERTIRATSRGTVQFEM